MSCASHVTSSLLGWVRRSQDGSITGTDPRQSLSVVRFILYFRSIGLGLFKPYPSTQDEMSISFTSPLETGLPDPKPFTLRAEQESLSLRKYCTPM